MSLRCTGLVFVVVICAVFLQSQEAKAQTGFRHGKQTYYHHEDPSCPFYPDFSTVEATLRSYIFLAKTERVAETLRSNELFSLGAGFTYRENEECLMVQTSNRARDPDIVAAHALALNAGETGETEKLARAMVLSFEIECQCSLFTAKQKEELMTDFKAVLDDPEERRIILEFGRTTEPHGHNVTYGAGHHSGRRLSVSEPVGVKNIPCSVCDPPNLCRDKRHLHWCQTP